MSDRIGHAAGEAGEEIAIRVFRDAFVAELEPYDRREQHPRIAP